MLKNPLENIAPMPGGEMSPEDMKAELEGDFAGVQKKKGDLDAKIKFGENQDQEQKKKAVIEVFQMMEKAGIDPSNLESIRAFLEKLEKRNPDLVELFEKSLDEILGGGAPKQEGGPMDKFKTLGKETTMPGAPMQGGAPPAPMPPMGGGLPPMPGGGGGMPPMPGGGGLPPMPGGGMPPKQPMM